MNVHESNSLISKNKITLTGCHAVKINQSKNIKDNEHCGYLCTRITQKVKKKINQIIQNDLLLATMFTGVKCTPTTCKKS